MKIDSILIDLSLLALIIGWLIILKVIMARLESRHPEKYDEMGRPGIFLQNSIGSNFRIFKYIFTREHASLNDEVLSRLTDGAFIYFLSLLLILAIYLLI